MANLFKKCYIRLLLTHIFVPHFLPISTIPRLVASETVDTSTPVSLQYKIITKTSGRSFSLSPYDLLAKQLLSRQETPWSKEEIRKTDESTRLSIATKKYQEGLIDANNYHTQLTELWSQTFPAKSSELWLVQAEIANKIDDLHQLFPDLPLITIKTDPAYVPPESKKNSLKYISFDSLDESLAYFNKETGVDQWESLLEGNHLIYYEPYSISETIQKIYGSESSLYKFFSGKRTTKALTKQIGIQTQKEYPDQSMMKSIAEFSVSSGIMPWVLQKSKITSDLQIRGTKWYFGKHIRDFHSLNEWFLRQPSPEAYAHILSEIPRPDGSSTQVIAGSESKIRVDLLSAGHLNQPQTIVGKVLSPQSGKQALRTGDHPAYYRQRYPFKTSELLSVNPDGLKSKKLAPGRFNHKNPGSGETGIIRQSALNLIFSELNQSDTIQVIQRLSPSDIHHFLSPARGKILSHKQTLEYFKEKLSGRGQISATQIKKLEYLILAAHSEEDRLGRDSLNYIQISGGYDSVGAEAVSLRPSILAENQRKVIVMDHSGGNFSVHVFIGATGVSNVRLDPEARLFDQGQPLGLMGTGLNYSKAFYQNMNFYFEARSETDQDGRKELVPGKYLGFFPANGSTIISYYLADYFQPVQKLQRFIDMTKNFEIRPEIKVHMGDLLLEAQAPSL